MASELRSQKPEFRSRQGGRKEGRMRLLCAPDLRNSEKVMNLLLEGCLFQLMGNAVIKPDHIGKVIAE